MVIPKSSIASKVSLVEHIMGYEQLRQESLIDETFDTLYSLPIVESVKRLLWQIYRVLIMTETIILDVTPGLSKLDGIIKV